MELLLLDTSGNWTDWLGADGMECFVDKNNNQTFFTEHLKTDHLYKSFNRWWKPSYY